MNKSDGKILEEKERGRVSTFNTLWSQAVIPHLLKVVTVLAFETTGRSREGVSRKIPWEGYRKNEVQREA